MNKKLEDKLMAKIKNNDVKMKPKWWFKAVKDGQILLLTSVFAISSLLITSCVYFVELINPQSLIKMGTIGREVLFENLPYPLILAALITIVFGVFIYPKIGDNYKKQKLQICLFVFTWIIILTIILTSLRFMLESGWFLF